MRETKKIWMNGELVDWGDATVHVGTPRPALRLGRLRGNPRLRDRARHVRLPPHRPSRAAPPLGAAALHGAPVLGRRAPHGDLGRDRRQRAAVVLPPPDCLLRLRRARGLLGGEPGRRRDHVVAVGRVPRRRGAAERDPREGLELAARRTERDPARREGDRRLPQLDARGRRGEPRGLRRGNSPDRRGLRRRRLGREHLPRARRRHLHAGPLRLDPRRHHARHRDPDRAGPRAPCRREAASSAPISTSQTRSSWSARPPR